MSTPYLFKGLVPPAAANAGAVLDGFAAIRRAYQARTEITAHARVYVGEERRDDLLDAVLTAPTWPAAPTTETAGEPAGGRSDRSGRSTEGFVAWMQDLVAADRFSLVINNLETVSPALAAGLGPFLASLFDGWGVPAGGAELVAFAGNYSGTAFGVHEGFEHAFLTHYGPGVKHFYTWPQADYQKLTGSSDPLYGDYTWLLEHGEYFVLEPGDALFLPQRVFHVGRQDEFSVSVAVPLYTYPDAALLRQAVLPQLLDELLAGGPDTVHGLPSPMAALNAGPTPVATRLAALADQTLAAAGRRAAAAVAKHAHQRWHTVLSNGGWEMVADDLARSEAASAFRPEHVQAGAVVAVTAPYRLLVSDGQAFLRGYEVAADPTVLTADLVSALNEGPLTLPADEQLLDIMRALGSTGGLHLTTPDAGTPDAGKEIPA